MKWIHNKQKSCLWTKIISTANQNSKSFVKYSIIYIHEYSKFRGVEIYCSEKRGSQLKAFPRLKRNIFPTIV